MASVTNGEEEDHQPDRICKVKEEVLDEDEIDEEERSVDSSGSENETDNNNSCKSAFVLQNAAAARATMGYGKQQPQQSTALMSRNYSDFMRSLAAKYNQRNPVEEEQEQLEQSFSLVQMNGLMHKLEGKMGSCSPPLELLLRQQEDMEQRTPLRPLVDLSSTHMLLHMMRSASAAAAESSKRPVEAADDALDLSVRAGGKRWKTGEAAVADPGVGLLSRPNAQRGHPAARDAFSDTGAALPRSSSTDDAGYHHNKPPRWRTPNNQRKSPSSASPAPASTSYCGSNCACKDKKTAAVVKWNVEDVCAFVSGVDACADYVQAFREQSIDGGALYMLTEDHLTNRMKMKLGHALRFKAALAKLIGACALCLHCVHCHQQPPAPTPPLQSNGGALHRQP